MLYIYIYIYMYIYIYNVMKKKSKLKFMQSLSIQIILFTNFSAFDINCILYRCFEGIGIFLTE